MYPWMMFWAPQLYFPLSGDMNQRIDPHTTWFSELVKPGAGDVNIEKGVLDVASYGTQLSMLSKVLLDVAEQTEPTSEKGKQALEKLKTVSSQIEKIKQQNREDDINRLLDGMAVLKNKDPERYRELLQRIAALNADMHG